MSGWSRGPTRRPSPGWSSGWCDLGITHFVDDRLEVLGHLVGLVPHLFLFQSRAAGVDRFRDVLPHVRPVMRWSEIVEALL